MRSHTFSRTDHYLVDGYNLLFHLRDPNPLTPHREELIAYFNEVLVQKSIGVTLFFDGQEAILARKQHFSRVELFYTYRGQTADQAIIEELAFVVSPHVITNDRELGRDAKREGAKVSGTQRFLDWLFKGRGFKESEKKMTMTSREYDYWLKMFTKK